MYNRSKRETCYRVMAVFLFIIMLGVSGSMMAQQDLPEHDKQVHETSVSVQLLPVFAVDAKGNPIFDLQPEEMELWVDGKVTPILLFEGYQLELKKNTAQEVPATPIPRNLERITFIIMDTLISNRDIVELTKRVAIELIKNGAPGEAFLLLESNQMNGFQYLAGPTKDRKELIEKVVAIKKQYLSRDMFLSRFGGMIANSSNSDVNDTLAVIDKLQKDKEIEMYQRDIQNFSRGLKQLKYALKSTTLPKTVYLITGQSQILQATVMPATYLTLLEEAARSINYGGGVFYLINPLPQKKAGQGNELKFMAEATGGKFFSGTGLKDVIHQVEKNTSAYYELAFKPIAKEGQKSDVRIACKRKGVSLTYINAYEQERTYAKMNDTERKMFVLNIISGGFWSQSAIPIHKLSYSALNAQSPSPSTRNVQVTMPQEVNQKTFHCYQVTLDETTFKADFQFSEKTIPTQEPYSVPLVPGKKSFLVFIEASGSVCYAGQVI